MGNFSRNTFDRLKHYVGVRLQQGVPIVDADWNELEDIRKHELQCFLKWFVGNGVPNGNDGFCITPTTDGNSDFTIKGGKDGEPGYCLVDGWEIMINEDINYTAQALFNGDALAEEWGVEPVKPLLPPENGTRMDRVYLDVWEREVGEADDPSLLHPAINIQTCVRIKREWVVRVIQGMAEPIPPREGHAYYIIANILMSAGTNTITDCYDKRQTGLSIQPLGSISLPVNTGFVTNAHSRQVNVSGSSAAIGEWSQVNTSQDGEANGCHSQVNACFQSRTGGEYAQVSASSGGRADGSFSQVNASARSTASGDYHSQVNASTDSTAGGGISQVNASSGSKAESEYSQVNVSRYSTVCGGQSQVNGCETAIASGAHSQVNVSSNSTASGTRSQLNACHESTAAGDFSQVNASTYSLTSENMSQVNVSDNSKALGNHSQINASNVSMATGYLSQVNASNNSAASSGRSSQVNASSLSTASGVRSQVNASEKSTASGDYQSQVNASENSTARGRRSQVNASENSMAGGSRSQVNASWNSTAGATSSQVNGSLNSIAAYDVSQVSASYRVESGRVYTVCGGYASSGDPSPNNRKWELDSFSGDIIYRGGIRTSLSDYGEYFENLKKKEIDVGLLIALDSSQVRPAKKDEEFIGVVSGTAAIRLGDSPFCWRGRYIYDEWGRPVYEEIKDPAWQPKEGQTEDDRPTVRVQKENPDYDIHKEQIPRSERPDEWTLVGLLGQVYVRCDDTVKPGDCVKSKGRGIGTISREKTKLKAMKVTKPFDGKYSIVYCLLN